MDAEAGWIVRSSGRESDRQAIDLDLVTDPGGDQPGISHTPHHPPPPFPDRYGSFDSRARYVLFLPSIGHRVSRWQKPGALTH